MRHGSTFSRQRRSRYKFPFSDLSSSKLRPAVILADVGQGDFLLCQVTSNPYSDPNAIELRDEHFTRGSLQRISYIRPGKLFTANFSLIDRQIGVLENESRQAIAAAIEALLRPG